MDKTVQLMNRAQQKIGLIFLWCGGPDGGCSSVDLFKRLPEEASLQVNRATLRSAAPCRAIYSVIRVSFNLKGCESLPQKLGERTRPNKVKEAAHVTCLKVPLMKKALIVEPPMLSFTWMHQHEGQYLQKANDTWINSRTCFPRAHELWTRPIQIQNSQALSCSLVPLVLPR
eukprot:5759961-Amphidinium_carterae.1